MVLALQLIVSFRDYTEFGGHSEDNARLYIPYSISLTITIRVRVHHSSVRQLTLSIQSSLLRTY